jgi:uncharacterized heparinase superfamily protein
MIRAVANAAEAVARYAHTVRHLRAEQIMHRASRRLLPGRRVRTPLVAERRDGAGPWQSPIAKRDVFVAPGRVVLLGVERTMSADLWRSGDLPRLARYQLHYFDDLSAAGAALKTEWHREMLTRWLAENPRYTGDAWDPYPTSLRIVNWIKWALSGNRLPEPCERSLQEQAEWLGARIEYDLLANHVFENAKALVFAGCYFSGAHAQRWSAIGWRVLREQIAEQVLADGGHFERSPTYHALVLEGLLDLINVCRRFAQPLPFDLATVCSRMLTWLDAMSHPDGAVALLNDATLDGAPNHAQLLDYARRLGLEQDSRVTQPLHPLLDSGYLRAQVGRAVCILDAAPLGPDYQPAHGHADTLTFELSLDGRRIVVDTGVSTYEAGSRRTLERSTAAHNTWTVDGRNSSDMWAAFRVGRRARVRNVRADASNGRVHVQAEHDGYAHLRAGVVHRRTWDLRDDALVIRDEFAGRNAVALAGALHFHPSLRVTSRGERRWLVEDQSGRALLEVTADDRVEATVEWYDYAPNFGELLRAMVLRFQAQLAGPAAIDTRLVFTPG